MNSTALSITYLLITRSPANLRVTSRGVKLLVRIEARLGTRFVGRRVHIVARRGGGGAGGGGGVAAALVRVIPIQQRGRATDADGSRSLGWRGITACRRRRSSIEAR